MSLSYDQRKADPKWQKAGELFGATIETQVDWAGLDGHARGAIRYAVREAAIGAPRAHRSQVHQAGGTRDCRAGRVPAHRAVSTERR